MKDLDHTIAKTRFERQMEELERISLKITILQIVALFLAGAAGIYMTSNQIYFEQIYIVPCYFTILFGIMRLNKKWCNRVKDI